MHMMRGIRVEFHMAEGIMASTCGQILTLPILADYRIFETAMKVVISRQTSKSYTMT